MKWMKISKKHCTISGIVDSQCYLGLWNGEILVGMFAYSWESKELYLDGIAIRKGYRGSLKALYPLVKKIITEGKPKVIWAHSESTAGENLVKHLSKKLSIPVCDTGRLERIMKKQSAAESGMWQKFV